MWESLSFIKSNIADIVDGNEPMLYRMCTSKESLYVLYFLFGCSLIFASKYKRYNLYKIKFTSCFYTIPLAFSMRVFMCYTTRGMIIATVRQCCIYSEVINFKTYIQKYWFREWGIVIFSFTFTYLSIPPLCTFNQYQLCCFSYLYSLTSSTLPDIVPISCDHN